MVKPDPLAQEIARGDEMLMAMWTIEMSTTSLGHDLQELPYACRQTRLAQEHGQ